MSNPLTQKRWSPYVVGAGIGVLSWLTFLTMDKALGTSSSFVHVAGLFGWLVDQGWVVGESANPYMLKEINPKTPLLDWQAFLVIGLAGGALLASRLSGDRSCERVPGLWAWRFGKSVPLRYGAAFLAGVVMMFGARLAGGCTSGHGISGGLQLAVSSWVFFLACFAGGILAAFTLFGSKGRAHVLD